MAALSGTMKYILALTCLLQMTETKVVVHIPFPYTSHIRYHTDVARSLVKKGHQVWITIPSHVSKTNFLDTSDIRVIPYDTMPDLQEKTRKEMVGRYFEGKRANYYAFLQICSNVTDNLLRNNSFLMTIKEKRADLIVIDNVVLFDVITIIPYRLGIPFAFLGSMYYPISWRVPFSPAEVPIPILGYSNKMTFFQRVNLFLVYFILLVFNPVFSVNAVQMYAPEMKYIPLDELISQAEIFVVEVDHVLDYPKPVLPNVKLIGGTSTAPAKPLPTSYQSFMDSAKEGVVIASFGSYTLNPPKPISDKMFEVLLQLPMKSVFRSNITSPDPKKILTSPWIPQNDLLGHPHTKVFVSHCGKNGQYQALYHAVPIVATPFVGDQPYNAERARVKGFAEVLDLNSCTADQMKSTILTVANEPRYKQAVVKRSRLFKELYGVPVETAAYWLDHVMEYGGDYMRSAGQQMPLYQFMLLDVLLSFVCLLALVFVLVCALINFIYNFISNKKMKLD